MSKPRRDRPGRQPQRQAPVYKRLSEDHYAELDEREKRRHDLHLDVDAIIDATPYAERDKDSIGFPGSDDVGRGGGADPGKLNAVEAAAIDPRLNTAIDWLADAKEARSQIVRVANRGRLFYGFDPERGRPEPNRPQQRQNTTERCAFCDEPAPEGRDTEGKPLVRRIDQRPVHRSPCYSTLASQALRAGLSVAAYLQTHNRA